MTPQEINKRIAVACGWKLIPGSHVCWSRDGGITYSTRLPNYYDDLNAMHEAEKIFDLNIESPDSLRYRYSRELYLVVTPEEIQPFRACSRQRAKAFLLTLGQWSED